MLKIFRKSFYVPYDDGTSYPTTKKAQQAITKYCQENGFSCSFPGDDEVTINGITHDICRGYEHGCRGYAIKLREK